MARGTPSSPRACTDPAGACQTGAASHCVEPVPGSNRPLSATATTPTSNATMIGGSHFRGQTDARKKANTIGPAMARSSRIACTRSVPKRRKTPATMAITIGIGTTAMARRTQPERPSTSMRSPVA